MRGRARVAGLSLASVILAGTALVPVSAQTLDLGGVVVNRSELITGGPYTEITNGTLRFTPDVPNAPHIFGGSLTDSLGQFSLLKRGTGSLTLTGTSNTFSGNTRVENGQLIAGATNTLSGSSTLEATSVGVVDLNGFDQAVKNLTGSGTVTNSSATLASLTLNGIGSISYTGALTGNLRLV
ncbi:autotransporter-associated beta strand repeat-containing protein, partial [Polymorphobacter sp.]|uniref:autotransporter-associated beta strand repeat-containing protein n=1 Tax=Polymorphobacter sp. TaxID=1909290 RepID=UPI003F72D030